MEKTYVDDIVLEDWEERPKDITYHGLRFHNTCQSTPEQYDIFDDTGQQVGYIRLRYGNLTAACPDIGGTIVYRRVIGDGEWTGEFPTDEQRQHHLKRIAKTIRKFMKGDSEE